MTLPAIDAKVLNISQPVVGNYVIKVTGTGEGTYALSIRTYDQDINLAGAAFNEVPISNGVAHMYTVPYTGKPIVDQSTIKVTGLFNGGGQRPRDVNKFLSYGSPTEAQTSLPAGTLSYPVQSFMLRISFLRLLPPL